MLTHGYSGAELASRPDSARNDPRPSGDVRRGEPPTDGMDGGEYMDGMDPTLAELGDEFTLGDIDGE